MPEMNFEDIVSRFKDTLVMHGKSPVFVNKVLDESTLEVFELEKGVYNIVPFSLSKFKVPPRIGMVNVHDGVVYVERLPARMWKVGVDRNNLTAASFNKVKYSTSPDAALSHVLLLRSIEIFDAIKGSYPTFKQAVKTLSQFDGAIAFDKQFAITSDGLVLYKTSTVGKWETGAKSPEDILFKDQYKYLKNLIGKNYENCFATSKSSQN